MAPFLQGLPDHRAPALLEAVSPLRGLRCQFTDVSTLVLDPSSLTITRLISWAVQLRLQWLQLSQTATEQAIGPQDEEVGTTKDVEEVEERLRLA